ncbi:hypothetical protein KIN09_14455, partial [Vibrio cholerae]
KVQGKGISIVLPEGTDERILGAAERLAKEELVKPILVGNKEEISAKAASMNLTLAGVDIKQGEFVQEYNLHEQAKHDETVVVAFEVDQVQKANEII